MNLVAGDIWYNSSGCSSYSFLFSAVESWGSEVLHGDCVDVLRDFDGERPKNDAPLHKIRVNSDNKR